MSFLSFLCIDLFTHTPQLTYNRKSQYSSAVGVFVTYLYLGVCILALLTFGRELILRENPNVIESEKRLSDSYSPKIPIESKELKIGFSLFKIDQGMIPVDETYFTLEGEQVIIKANNEVGLFDFIYKRFRINVCSDQDQPILDLKNNLSAKGKYLCMEPNFYEMVSNKELNYSDEDLKKFYLRGLIGNDEYSQINVYLRRCNNSSNKTDAPICKPLDEINSKIDQIYVGGTILNKYLQLQDYSDPFRHNLDWFYIKPKSTMRKELQLFLQKNSLVTDTGLVDNNPISQDFLTVSQSKEILETEYSDTDKEDDNFVTISFQIDRIQKEYIRKYKKIQDLAAELGGTLKFFLMILTFIMKPIVRRKYEIDFVQSILGFEKFQEHLMKESSIGILGKLKNWRTTRKMIIGSFFIGCDKVYNHIKQKTDLKNLFRKMIELEILTKIIFENYQYLLFKKLSHDRDSLDLKKSPDKFQTKYLEKQLSFDENRDDYFQKHYSLALLDLKKKRDVYSTIDKNLRGILGNESQVEEGDKFNQGDSSDVKLEDIFNEKTFMKEPNFFSPPGKLLINNDSD